MEQGRAWFFGLIRRYGFEANRVLRGLAVAAVLVAWGVTWTGLIQTPTYKASALILVGWQQEEDQWPNWGGSGEEMQTLEYRAQLTQPMVLAIDSHIVAAETIEHLDLPMEPAQLLHRLSVEQVENTEFIVLSYEDTDPQRAKLIANTVGDVASKFASDRSEFSVIVWEKAVMPTTPVSPQPWRNGFLTLVVGLALAGMLTHSLPRSLAAEAALIADGLVEGSKVRIGQALTVARTRLAGGRRAALEEAEAIKEKKLLLALGRCGKLTVLEAALEAELSVEEADRMLSELVDQGHLQPGIKDGRLVYSFWGEDRA